MEILLEMSGYIKIQNMNCLIKKISDFISNVFIEVLSMKQASYLQIFSLNLLNYAYLIKQLQCEKVETRGTILR